MDKSLICIIWGNKQQRKIKNQITVFQILLLQLIQEKNTADGQGVATRADMRLGLGPNDQMFVLNKRDGTIRLLVAVRWVVWKKGHIGDTRRLNGAAVIAALFLTC